MMLKKQLVALVSIAFSGILLFGCGQRRSDSHLGPAPHFTWINHGDARPAPHILRLEGPSPASGDAMERCQKRPGPAACLLRNWRTYLAALGQGELSAPPGTRSYRAVIEPACNGAIMVRLDLTAGGQATLTTVHAPNAPPGARFAELPVALGQRLWRRTASASTDDVAAVTRALRANLFDLITADPSALWIRAEAGLSRGESRGSLASSWLPAPGRRRPSYEPARN